MLGFNFFGPRWCPRERQEPDQNYVLAFIGQKTEQRRCGIKLKCLPFFFAFEERVVPTNCGRKSFACKFVRGCERDVAASGTLFRPGSLWTGPSTSKTSLLSGLCLR